MQRDGILMIGSFYDPDMQIYVDGKKAETLNLQGLTGVKLSAGPHKIVMKYHTPGFWIGHFFIAALLLAIASELKRKRWHALVNIVVYRERRKSLFVHK